MRKYFRIILCFAVCSMFASSPRAKAEAVRAVTEVAQNGETTLPDGTIVPIPDRSELKLVNKQMQDVCDDPANKWILTIPHVTKCEPTILRELGPGGEALPAVGIEVDREENIESVKRKTPSILGGFPIQFWPDYMEVEGNQVLHYPPSKGR
jgi:hypothetical protein